MNLVSQIKRTSSRVLILCLLCTGWVSTSQAASPGFQQLETARPDSGETVQLIVWYPTSANGETKNIGRNAVFKGTDAQPNAEIENTRHPLVLISHGGFRSSAQAINWFAAGLARQGFIAVVVVPPALVMPPTAQQLVDELTRRPADISLAIETLLNNHWQQYITQDQIGLVGFFLGGYSVLRLAGIETNANLVAQACVAPVKIVDCQWIQQLNLDLINADTTRLSLPVVNQRVRTVISVDPEWRHILKKESIEKTQIPTLLVNSEEAAATDSVLNASALRPGNEQVSYTKLNNTGLFSSFPVCQPKGASILAEDGGNPALCNNYSPGISREETHGKFIDTAANWLRTQLTRAATR